LSVTTPNVIIGVVYMAEVAPDWSPDEKTASLISRIIARHRDVLARAFKSDRERIVNSAAARGVLRSGGTIKALRNTYSQDVREYAQKVTDEVMGVMSADGTLDDASAAWLRTELERNFDAVAQGVGRAIANDQTFRGLPTDDRGVPAALASELKRELGITLDKSTLRRPQAAISDGRRDDAADRDPLVPLKNRRAYDDDLHEQFNVALANGQPLALIVFDIDRFKSVNDDHGGHATGDEALIAVAQIALKCVSGKGTAYRFGGDEFAIVLPNHSTNEAIAVAERVRRSVNERPLTSRSITLSASIGVAVIPDHGADPEALKKAADAAAYDAKRNGRNLVRVFGEPPPTAVEREPERKVAEPGTLSSEQRQKIRQDYFRDGFARCPADEAMLKVQDTTTFGSKTASILVLCPLCGFQEELSGDR
jgi:diguanylate cyclase (GGDEF)-like protein